jgi:hypothetical protein
MRSLENQDELYELLGALCNDCISSERYMRLENLLRSDPSARKLYFDYVDVHLELNNLGVRSESQRPFGQLKQELDRVSADKSGEKSGDTQSPAPAAPRHISKKWPKGIAYLLVMAASMLGLFGIQQLLQIDAAKPNGPPLVKRQSVVPDYVATLLKSVDCKWSGDSRPQFDGQRLLSKEIWLDEGYAELGFDSGVRIVLQGPIRLSIDSSNNATLHSGSLVLHGDESAAPFVLKTPHTTLLDIGTEYGASVPDGETTDVHVFSGEVIVNSLGELGSGFKQESLQQGETAKFNRRGLLPATVNDISYVRRIPVSAIRNAGATEQLLAIEDFEYSTPTIAHANGGQGFDGPWRHKVGVYQPSEITLSHQKSLSKGRSASTKTEGQALELIGASTLARTLKSPIRLDVDAVYYVSFFVQKVQSASPDESQYFGFSFRTANSPVDFRKLHFGMTSTCYPTLTHNDKQITVAPALPVGETAMFVVKIIAGKNDPDQLMLRVYGSAENVPKSETLIWNCATPAQLDDTIFDQILLIVSHSGHYFFDKIRIGTTWNSVTSHATGPTKHE